METAFTVTCVKSDYGDFFTDFGIHKDHAHIWGVKGEDVLEVKMRVSENQSPPDWNAQEYWGWYDFELKEFSLIFPNYKLLFVCFPYGIKSAEDCGKGKAYRLEIINII